MPEIAERMREFVDTAQPPVTMEEVRRRLAQKGESAFGFTFPRLLFVAVLSLTLLVTILVSILVTIDGANQPSEGSRHVANGGSADTELGGPVLAMAGLTVRSLTGSQPSTTL